MKVLTFDLPRGYTLELFREDNEQRHRFAQDGVPMPILADSWLEAGMAAILEAVSDENEQLSWAKRFVDRVSNAQQSARTLRDIDPLPFIG